MEIYNVQLFVNNTGIIHLIILRNYSLMIVELKSERIEEKYIKQMNYNEIQISFNSVKNSLTFSYTSTIDEVMLYAAMGDKILTKKVNAMQCDIDLSDLGAGVYFLTIQSGAQQKTVKILKE